MIRTQRDLTRLQAPERTSGREWLPRPVLCAAKKCRFLVDPQPRRFDVPVQRGTRLELAAFSHKNITLHRPSHLHRLRPDLTAYARVLPDRERSGGIDCALHLAVEEQLVQEFTEPLIETPWERIAPDCVGMNVRLDGPGTTGGSGRFVCGGSVRLRRSKAGKRLHGEKCAESFG